MAKSAIITLTTAGTGTGPFNLLSDVDGYIIPFETNVSKSNLVAGYTSNLIPDFANTIRVQSVSSCTNYIDLPYPGISTTTTTSTTTSTTTPTPTTTSTTTSTTTAPPTTTTTTSTTTSTTTPPPTTTTTTTTTTTSTTTSTTTGAPVDVYMIFRVVNQGGGNYDLRFTLSDTAGSDVPEDQITVPFDIGTSSGQYILYNATCGAVDASGTWYLLAGNSTTTKSITCGDTFTVSSVQLNDPPFTYNVGGGYFEYTYLGTQYRIYIMPPV